jgi:(R,R)-butanediol dehydrogenase / meso-butanediol dehydrogenase / diacetyl reductase
MRSATYRGDRTVAVGDRDAVPPAGDEVRIDVAYTGIRGTDPHILHGAMDHRVTVPAVIGHEMSGRIAALDAGVTGWSVGDAVTVMPLRWCRNCPGCRSGNSHVCHRLRVCAGVQWVTPASRRTAAPASRSCVRLLAGRRSGLAP